MRRNVDLKVLLFNNRIYGLTKGQFSPTSVRGQRTPSTPLGSLDPPFNPVALALGAGATFVARSVDRFGTHLAETLELAAAHRGTAFVEIYQNCNIFNDGAFGSLTDKVGRVENALYLKPGEPLRFGREGEFGLGSGREATWSGSTRPPAPRPCCDTTRGGEPDPRLRPRAVGSSPVPHSPGGVPRRPASDPGRGA